MLRAGWKKGAVLSTGLNIKHVTGRTASLPASSEARGASAGNGQKRFGDGFTGTTKALKYCFVDLQSLQPALLLTEDPQGNLVLPPEPEMKMCIVRHAKLNDKVPGKVWGPTSQPTPMAMWYAVAKSKCARMDPSHDLGKEGTVPAPICPMFLDAKVIKLSARYFLCSRFHCSLIYFS